MTKLGISTNKKQLLATETIGALKVNLDEDLTAHVFTEACQFAIISNGNKPIKAGVNYSIVLDSYHIKTKGYEADKRKKARALRFIKERGLKYLSMASEGIMTTVSLCNNLTTGANVVFIDNENGHNELQNYDLMESTLDMMARGQSPIKMVLVLAFKRHLILNLLKRYRRVLIGAKIMDRSRNQGVLFLVCRKDDYKVRTVLERETENRLGSLVQWRGPQPKEI
jgi:hypothetical protein